MVIGHRAGYFWTKEELRAWTVRWVCVGSTVKVTERTKRGCRGRRTRIWR